MSILIKLFKAANAYRIAKSLHRHHTTSFVFPVFLPPLPDMAASSSSPWGQCVVMARLKEEDEERVYVRRTIMQDAKWPIYDPEATAKMK
jgi:hypothetical protein